MIYIALKREEITAKELKQLEIQRQLQEKEALKKEITKEKKQIEFSKKIMFFVMATAFAVILFSMYIIRITENTTYLDTLITETFSFSKIAVGFYSAKAATENYQKIKNIKACNKESDNKKNTDSDKEIPI